MKHLFARAIRFRFSDAAFLLGVVWLFFAPQLRGQATQGAILGSVTDASGAGVPGAKATIRNEGTNFVREITTNESGDYRVAGLEPGFYEVTVANPSFKTFKQTRVDVAANQIKRVNANLEVGDITTTVEVEGGHSPDRDGNCDSVERENVTRFHATPLEYLWARLGEHHQRHSGHPVSAVLRFSGQWSPRLRR